MLHEYFPFLYTNLFICNFIFFAFSKFWGWEACHTCVFVYVLGRLPDKVQDSQLTLQTLNNFLYIICCGCSIIVQQMNLNWIQTLTMWSWRSIFIFYRWKNWGSWSLNASPSLHSHWIVQSGPGRGNAFTYVEVVFLCFGLSKFGIKKLRF